MIEEEGNRTLPASTNPRHEQFAQLVAGGRSRTESFTSVGYSRKNAASCALRLSKKEQVQARIEELQQTVAQAAITRASVDRSWVLTGLRKIAENGSSESAGVRAYELCGKELGMFADRSGGMPTLDLLRWDGDLTQLTDEQLKWLEQLLQLVDRSEQRQRGMVIDAVAIP